MTKLKNELYKRLLFACLSSDFARLASNSQEIDFSGQNLVRSGTGNFASCKSLRYIFATVTEMERNGLGWLNQEF